MKGLKFVLFVLAVTLTIGLCDDRPADACVGKALHIGSTGTPQQQLLAQLLGILISERTGTSVEIVQVAGHAAAHEALLRADLDMYVEYTGISQVQILGGTPIADQAALYKTVKDRYNQELNLVWLEPLGFNNAQLAPAGTVAEAAPVVRKDTLKKFPALARLLNKLAGTIDLATMQKLEAKAAGENAREVARRYLKENRFI